MSEEDRAAQQTISETLYALVHKPGESDITLGELMRSLHEKGFALLMMVLVLPNCVPIPVPPGTSTVFSLPLLFLSVQMLAGFDAPWVPRSLARRKLSRGLLARVLKAAGPYLQRIEKALKPRFGFLMGPEGERVIGAVWLVFALSIAVPLPMTNFLPGVGILVSAMGFLRRDGIVLLVGMGIGALGVLFSLTLLTFGMAFLKKLLFF